MEQKPSIVEKWKPFLLGFLLGFLVFVFYLDKVHQDINFLAAKKAMVDLVPFQLLNNPSTSVIIKPLKPSTSIVNPSTNVTIKPLKASTSIADNIEKSTKKERRKCNMFEGKWVYKAEEGPRYDSFKCPFINEKFSCQANGRLDSKYEKWRWEARDCDIPVDVRFFEDVHPYLDADGTNIDVSTPNMDASVDLGGDLDATYILDEDQATLDEQRQQQPPVVTVPPHPAVAAVPTPEATGQEDPTSAATTPDDMGRGRRQKFVSTRLKGFVTHAQ
uniref:Trichome birefringence-like N-terminal domain-containing protein n=1 Tax=Chenopodium quinoa TaxID=63459 RepID=A0A803N1T4_CHEQI